ncbi:MAG: hypothetical protein AAF921_08575 [Cyanobacteria bacterium P01_D01_bin.44]
MPRLSERAFSLLNQELKRLIKPLEQVRYDIVLKRLQKFCQQDGPPLDYDALREAIIDIFPEFDDGVLRKAAQVNQPNPVVGAVGWIATIAVGAVAIAGGLWIINLPYPMIRWPVARTAPMLLLPSFMRMDHNYRQAIIYTEQADQLINNATSAQDFELGADKADQAQRHLDKLPVWFLGYYPQRYCAWFNCGWQFTLDEFEDARALIGRMDAQIFQEENALQLLEEGTLAVETAKRRYEALQSTEEKLTILGMWQEGMDKLNEIPSGTLAGQTAQTRLEAFQRDYETVAGTRANASQPNTFVQVAKQYAAQATQAAQNPPHTADTWGRIVILWAEAIDQLDQVPPNSPGYTEAQTLKVGYLNNLKQIKERRSTETAATQTLKQVEARVTRLIQTGSTQPTPQLLADLQSVINQLDKIPPGTTAYDSAQQLLQQAENRLSILQTGG